MFMCLFVLGVERAMSQLVLAQLEQYLDGSVELVFHWLDLARAEPEFFTKLFGLARAAYFPARLSINKNLGLIFSTNFYTVFSQNLPEILH